ncbi:MAG: flagellar export chaperone FliS [Methylophilaceae bacterium]|nr:flagellar export chaperone FliS [Methylophilaceae bacterium]
MFGMNKRGVHEYTKVGMETGVIAANPHGLVVMLYDGAVAACHSGLVHMQKNEIAEKGKALSKAIMIIESGLRISLDKNAGGDIANSLDALYAYMVERLYAAHLKNKPEHVQEVIKLLADLRSAWAAIAQNPAIAANTSAAYNKIANKNSNAVLAKG